MYLLVFGIALCRVWRRVREVREEEKRVLYEYLGFWECLGRKAVAMVMAA